MGVVECTNHNLLEPFHVLYEKEGIFMIIVILKLITTVYGRMMNTFFPRQKELVALLLLIF